MISRVLSSQAVDPDPAGHTFCLTGSDVVVKKRQKNMEMVDKQNFSVYVYFFFKRGKKASFNMYNPWMSIFVMTEKVF